MENRNSVTSLGRSYLVEFVAYQWLYCAEVFDFVSTEVEVC